MRLYYRLYEKDYLQHQLYLASIYKSIGDRRKGNYFWVMAFFSIFAVVADLLIKNAIAIPAIIFAAIAAIFYPAYEINL